MKKRIFRIDMIDVLLDLLGAEEVINVRISTIQEALAVKNFPLYKTIEYPSVASELQKLMPEHKNPRNRTHVYRVRKTALLKVIEKDGIRIMRK